MRGGMLYQMPETGQDSLPRGGTAGIEYRGRVILPQSRFLVRGGVILVFAALRGRRRMDGWIDRSCSQPVPRERC